MHPGTLETARLRLRPIDHDDAPFVLGLLNEPSFLQYIGDRGVRTVEAARQYIANGPQASYARHGHGLLLVELRESGIPIGICGLLKRDHLEAPDLGFAFVPTAWSRGYGFESATAVLGDSDTRLGLSRVLAIVNPDNARSIALLSRLGFQPAGQVTADEQPINVYSRTPPLS